MSGVWRERRLHGKLTPCRAPVGIGYLGGVGGRGGRRRMPIGGLGASWRPPPYRQHKGLNNQLTPADPTTRTADEAVQVGPTCSALPSAHDQINNLFLLPRHRMTATRAERPSRRGTTSAAPSKPHNPHQPVRRQARPVSAPAQQLDGACLLASDLGADLLRPSVSVIAKKPARSPRTRWTCVRQHQLIARPHPAVEKSALPECHEQGRSRGFRGFNGEYHVARRDGSFP